MVQAKRAHCDSERIPGSLHPEKRTSSQNRIKKALPQGRTPLNNYFDISNVRICSYKNKPSFLSKQRHYSYLNIEVMAMSNHSLLNEFFEEVPVEVLPTTVREQIIKTLDVDFEKLNARERLQLLEGVHLILKLVFLIQENTRNQQRIRLLKRMLHSTNSGCKVLSAPEQGSINQIQLNQQIKKVI